MGTTTDTKTRAILNVIQIIVGLIAIGMATGSFYSAGERQKATDGEVKGIKVAQEEFRKERTTAMAAVQMNQISLEAALKANTSAVEELKRHVADRSIHVHEEQMRSMIAAQLQPLALAIKEVQTLLPAQQKQLDRIEAMLQATVRPGRAAQ